MRRIGVILGTRPEAIKLAPVVKALKATEGFSPYTVFTGQHTDLLDGAVAALGITADHTIDAMRPGQSLSALTGRLMAGLSNVVADDRLDAVLVQGDTTSALCGALSGFYEGVAVGHVEAGLRTDSIQQPFPEEANRRLISRIASLHFAPTTLAAERLRLEGVKDDDVFVTGNTSIDALIAKRAEIETEPEVTNGLMERLVGSGWRDREVVLVTVHRRENHGAPLERIASAIERVATTFPEAFVVLPVHANPAVGGPLRRALGHRPNVHLCEPLAYDDLLRVLSACRFVLSDSGGLQEEAPSFQKPILVMRTQTERPEGVTAGVAALVGSDADVIEAQSVRLLRDASAYERMRAAQNPYGDGDAAGRIVRALAERLSSAS